jgi:integrase
MGRAIALLSAVKVERAAKRAGMHCDGGGLYLCVAPPNGCSWVVRYMLEGRARVMGLGPYPAVSLAEARDKAAIARKLKAHGKDPITERDTERTRARLEAARAMTFKQCAEAYVASHKAGWRNTKHRKLWENTLAAYAFPVIGKLPVAEIDTGLVLQVLEPIWASKTETASRVRQRIESVLDWAKVRGHRQGENPARWRGHLDQTLPAQSEVRTVKHHAALPYADAPAFMAKLREEAGVSARALEFAILTAARSGEVRGARWHEIDLKNRLWVIPAERMKARRQHRVPLSDMVLETLEGLALLRTSDKNALVFPGARPMKPLSDMALGMLLRRMGRGDLTAHGFRSTFRDWCAEQTNTPNEVAEMALAHTVSDKVEAAYRRGDLFEKRRRLMIEWADYCSGGEAKGKRGAP